jgi:hypothetical protein
VIALGAIEVCDEGSGVSDCAAGHGRSP